MKLQLFRAILIAVLAAGSCFASAGIMYSFNHTVGAGSAVGSITTDGTIGALASGNILDWNIFLDGSPGNTFTLLGPLSGANSAVAISGGLVGSATALTFDFSSSSYALFQNPGIGSGMNFLCFAGQVCGGYSGAINVSTSIFGSGTSPMRGVQVVANATTGETPVPGTLAIFGLGMAVLGWTRRKSV